MVSPDDATELVLLRRVRDFVDRNDRDRLSVPVLAERATYLMTRRIERAMMLLRHGATVTDACFAVGCVSLGSFELGRGAVGFQARVGDSLTQSAVPLGLTIISAVAAIIRAVTL